MPNVRSDSNSQDNAMVPDYANRSGNILVQSTNRFSAVNICWDEPRWKPYCTCTPVIVHQINSTVMCQVPTLLRNHKQPFWVWFYCFLIWRSPVYPNIKIRKELLIIVRSKRPHISPSDGHFGVKTFMLKGRSEPKCS